MLIREKLALEDAVEDIVGKALKGLRLDVDTLAERADVPVDAVRKILNGDIEPDRLLPDQLLKVAFALNLHGPSLRQAAEGAWAPQPAPDPDGFAMFTTPYGDMTVNAFLVWDPQSREAASFDTGATCRPMLDVLTRQKLALRRIFITHTHMDHLADLDTLREESDGVGYGSAVDNPLGLKPLRHGDGLCVGNLRIRVLGTSGHTPGGLSYFIEGLATPLVVVGDALFAGSMGGAPHAWQEALENNRRHLLSLPPETVICPGHGPLTTVAEERAHNPFFPELK